MLPLPKSEEGDEKAADPDWIQIETGGGNESVGARAPVPTGDMGEERDVFAVPGDVTGVTGVRGADHYVDGGLRKENVFSL